MAGCYPPEIMLLQVCPCQSFATVTCWISNKGRVWIHTNLTANNTVMAWPSCPSSPFQSNRIIATRVLYPDCTERHLPVRWRLQWELERKHLRAW